MESHIIDGNNILEVYNKLSELKASMNEHPRPVLLEFKTFRMRGHEEASGTKYVPQGVDGGVGSQRSCRKLQKLFKRKQYPFGGI